MKKIIFTIEDLLMDGVYAISTVLSPAIESNFVALSSEKVNLKIDEERRMLFGALLIPDKEILRKDDKGEPYLIAFPKETISFTQELFFKKSHHQSATYEHQFTIDGMTVVESWIKESDNDKSVALGLNEPIGTWFVGMKVDNDEVWKRVKAGEIKGFSIEGHFAHMADAKLSLMLQEIETILIQNKQ